MRRANRQKTNGAENDWIMKRLRYAFGLNERPGRGKYSKRQMAQRRRREPIEADSDAPEGGR